MSNQRKKKKGVPPVISEYFAQLGKHKSGAGGRALAAKMSPEERSAAARKAVQARWAKARTKIEERAELDIELDKSDLLLIYPEPLQDSSGRPGRRRLLKQGNIQTTCGL